MGACKGFKGVPQNKLEYELNHPRAPTSGENPKTPEKPFLRPWESPHKFQLANVSQKKKSSKMVSGQNHKFAPNSTYLNPQSRNIEHAQTNFCGFFWGGTKKRY